MKKPLQFSLLLFVSVVLSQSASALIFHSTSDAAHNTNAPSGFLEDSGWQWQGEWSKGVAVAEYLGTPIAAHYFITAKHVAGTTSWDFHYKGKTYDVIQGFPDPSSDFQIWKVDEPFTSYAPLYTDSNESGKGCVIFGRGRTRGAEVETTRLNGWEWGTLDNKIRWGTNQISSVSTKYLFAKFNGAGTDECVLADKDSGGAVFIEDSDGVWRLAGINYALAEIFTTNSDGSAYFSAACFDYRGLYYYYFNTATDNYSWGGLAGGGQPKPQSSIASRISYSYSWITNVIGDELDVDVDQLPDWWENEHGTSATGMVASADSDGDGFTNLDEWYSDTNPTNDTLFFDNTGVFTITNQTFTFDGSTNRKYQVLYTTNDLADPSLTWFSNGAPVWGAGVDTEITVTNTEDTVFYRVQVSLP